MTMRRWSEGVPVPPVSRTVEERDRNLCGRHGEVCLCEKEVTLPFPTEVHERARYAWYREDKEKVLAHRLKRLFLEGVSQCVHVTVNTRVYLRDPAVMAYLLPVPSVALYRWERDM